MSHVLCLTCTEKDRLFLAAVVIINTEIRIPLSGISCKHRPDEHNEGLCFVNWGSCDNKSCSSTLALMENQCPYDAIETQRSRRSLLLPRQHHKQKLLRASLAIYGECCVTLHRYACTLHRSMFDYLHNRLLCWPRLYTLQHKRHNIRSFSACVR
jgi:hypothetical protein